jgi:hypothetical protein
MVGEEVAADRQLLVRHVEVVSEELDEVRKQLWVGVRQPGGIPSLVAFGPVQHAAGRILPTLPSCTAASLFLERSTDSACPAG